MFVSKGAKAAIMNKRKKNFYDDYIRRLIAEADSIGITRQELIAMIEAGDGATDGPNSKNI